MHWVLTLVILISRSRQENESHVKSQQNLIAGVGKTGPYYSHEQTISIADKICEQVLFKNERDKSYKLKLLFLGLPFQYFNV